MNTNQKRIEALTASSTLIIPQRDAPERCGAVKKKTASHVTQIALRQYVDVAISEAMLPY